MFIFKIFQFSPEKLHVDNFIIIFTVQLSNAKYLRFSQTSFPVKNPFNIIKYTFKNVIRNKIFNSNCFNNGDFHFHFSLTRLE